MKEVGMAEEGLYVVFKEMVNFFYIVEDYYVSIQQMKGKQKKL